jgi:hypothetical protein
LASPKLRTIQPYKALSRLYRHVVFDIRSEIDNHNEFDGRNLYRISPTEPTITNHVGFQCFVASLLHGLVTADHPLPEFYHEKAKQSFYSAVEHGLDADLAWITADGKRTTKAEVKVSYRVVRGIHAIPVFGKLKNTGKNERSQTPYRKDE